MTHAWPTITLRTLELVSKPSGGCFPPLVSSIVSAANPVLKLVLVAVWFGLAGSGSMVAQEQASPVVVSTVVEREVATEQTFVGTVKPLRTSVIGSAVDGRVIEFLVNEGDAVEKDQPLTKLRTETLAIELAVVKAELKLRQEALAELENGTRPEIIAQTKAGMLAAKSTMDFSHSNAKRTKTLFDQGRAVTERELQEALSTASRDEQTYLRAKTFHDLAVLGPRVEEILQAKARVLVQSEQVRLKEDKIAKHTIRSPFKGYVTIEHTEVGEWVSQGDPIVEIVQLSEVEVTASVLGQHTAQLQAGASARVEVPALAGEEFAGSVSVVIPKAEARSRTFPVKVRVVNRTSKNGPLLKAGMLARVALPTGEKKKMTLVPKDALVLGSGNPSIVVVDLDPNDSNLGQVRVVKVRMGISDGMFIQVTGPLKPGEKVVVRGNERLRPKQKVSIAELPTAEARQK